MMLPESRADTINMNGLEKSGHHIPDEFIKIILVLILAPRYRAQITYKTLHKGWIMLWWYFLYLTQRASEIEREADVSEKKGNCSYNEQRQLNRYPPPQEVTDHNFIGVLTKYNIIMLTVWGEQYHHYKLLWKLRQVIRGNELQLDIYY